MATNTTTTTGVLSEDDVVDTVQIRTAATKTPKESHKEKYRIQIMWPHLIVCAYIHIAAVYGAYLMLTSCKINTTIWAFLLYQAGVLGITAGVHRLWCHRAYKAKWPLRLILMLLNTLAFQKHIYQWAHEHRVHHKYSDTDADPHNASRGFFFSHMGWLLVRKHPDVVEKGKGIDTSDLDEDIFVMFQKKYYNLIMPIICFVLPTVIPVYVWGETWANAWFVAAIFRYACSLNLICLVNSAAHMWGSRPYDKYINPADNLTVNTFALGEGWHNYHHVFPWDYKPAELGKYSFNYTTAFINFFCHIGWAYDLKTVPLSVMLGRMERTGDGSHKVWGWEDKDMRKEDTDKAHIINKKSK